MSTDGIKQVTHEMVRSHLRRAVGTVFVTSFKLLGWHREAGLVSLFM